jgi:type II secretory pathway predicted ATPase ExeA
MYEHHFGLKKRPFRASAIGTDVFVGPQIATTMAGLKKALTVNDAIASISGPVGSGKTTLVSRALESLGTNQKTVLVARMRLDSNDVLEFLLDELGIEEMPNGTIQRFALFRRHLKKLAEHDERLYIVIEDGVRLGADTLAELEALTAADAGESEGASILLMGDEALDALLREAPLARIQQRIRQHVKITALPVAELRGYLRHCFRLAGRDFEQIFEPNAAELLHHLCGGIPRMANNLVESAMTAAADQDLDKVATTLLARIAENEYGLSAADFDLETQPVAATTDERDAEAVPELPVVVVEAPEPEPEPLVIPELIQDTLPDLAILAPDLAAVAKEPELEPESVIDPTPAVQNDVTAASESSGNDVPDWDRDPTVAELRPDLAALEQAMAFAQGDDPEPAAADDEPLPVPEPETPEVIPEITLDHAISQRIESKLIDEPGEVSAPAPAKTPATAAANNTTIPSLDSPPKQDKKADAEIERIATELAKAKSLEDVDDKLAETLFGDEINFVAAQVLANPSSGEPANDTHEAVVATGQAVARGSAAADLDVTLEDPRKLDDGGLDLSASQRLKTVRAINSDLHPSIREPEVLMENQAAQSPVTAPESIEDQINTSMTQTLKALNVVPPVIDVDDDDDPKGGFFSRFKKS